MQSVDTNKPKEFEALYQRDPDVVSRQIAGETILVPIRRNAADLESIYLLNETAASAWALMDGQRTLAEIRDAMVAQYDVSREEAGLDLAELVTRLESLGALVRR
jgi:hypothetical protein